MTDIQTYVMVSENLSRHIHGAVKAYPNGYVVVINGKLNKDNQQKEFLRLMANAINCNPADLTVLKERKVDNEEIISFYGDNTGMFFVVLH